MLLFQSVLKPAETDVLTDLDTVCRGEHVSGGHQRPAAEPRVVNVERGCPGELARARPHPADDVRLLGHECRAPAHPRPRQLGLQVAGQEWSEVPPRARPQRSPVAGLGLQGRGQGGQGGVEDSSPNTGTILRIIIPKPAS